MTEDHARQAPGRVRDGIVQVMSHTSQPLAVKEIEERVSQVVGPTRGSSIRSYLRLNTPSVFAREGRGVYRLRSSAESGVQRELPSLSAWEASASFGQATLHHADCFDWLREQDDNSMHAVVTDPPYGLHEYTTEQQAKLRKGKGGVWRIPPSFDGHRRSPLPRFTTLTREQLNDIRTFFFVWARLLLPKLVPGAQVVVASNPLVSYLISGALADAGLERRGEVVRLTMTMRGGDRPKAAHDEVSRSQRHAALDVGALGRIPKAPSKDGCRTTCAPGRQVDFADRTPTSRLVTSSPRRRPEKPNATSRRIPASSRKPSSALSFVPCCPLGEGRRPRPIRGRRIHPRRRGGRRLRKHWNRKGRTLFRDGQRGDSQTDGLFPHQRSVEPVDPALAELLDSAPVKH